MMKPIVRWQYKKLEGHAGLLEEHIADPECPCNSDGENCARKHLSRIEDYGQETIAILARDPKSTAAEMNRLDEIILEARGYREAEERHICGKKVSEKEFVPLSWASNLRKYFETLLVGTCDASLKDADQTAELRAGAKVKISGSCQAGKACNFKVKAVETTQTTAASIKDLARAIEEVETRAAQDTAAGSDRTFAQGTTNVTRYEFQFKIMDAAKLIVSNNPFTFAPTPGYPRELQPRLRDRAATRLQVERLAANLDPDALLVDYHSIDRGAPIIGPDNVVESGNGRMMAVINAHTDHPAVFERYVQALREIAPKYNLDPGQLDKYKIPVLVRLRTSKVNRKTFVEEANASTTIESSSIEKARADAEKITVEMLDGIEVLEGESIEDALRSSRNRQFVQAFLAKLPSNEQAKLVDAKGELNQDGVRRATMAIFVATFPGDIGLRLAERFFESTDTAVRNVFNGLSRSLGPLAIAEGFAATGQRDTMYTIGEDLAKAITVLVAIKKTPGMTVKKYLAQQQLLERELTPFQEHVLEVLDENSRSAKKIGAILGEYAQLVIDSPPPAQGGLFPGMERVSKEELFDTAIRRGSLADIIAGAFRDKKLQIGDEIRIMGVDMVLARADEIGGISYELFNGARMKEKRAAIRVTDLDSGLVATLKLYPDYDLAEEEYEEALRIGGLEDIIGASLAAYEWLINKLDPCNLDIVEEEQVLGWKPLREFLAWSVGLRVGKVMICGTGMGVGSYQVTAENLSSAQIGTATTLLKKISGARRVYTPYNEFVFEVVVPEAPEDLGWQVQEIRKPSRPAEGVQAALFRNVRYNRADIDDTIRAAKIVAARDKRNVYVYATAYGYTIGQAKPPGSQAYVIVGPDGDMQIVRPMDEIPERNPQLGDAEACERPSARYQYLEAFYFAEELAGLSAPPPRSGTPEGERKIDKALAQLEDGIKEIYESDNYREYLQTLGKFHHYSLGNLILIAAQRQDATRVAGFNTWKDLGRIVKRGEKGIMILAPCFPAKGKKSPEPEPEEEEEEEAEKRQPVRVIREPMYYKVVYVFDIAQTEGKELPVVEVPVVQGEDSRPLFELGLEYMRRAGITFITEPREAVSPSTYGYWDPARREIWVRSGVPQNQQTKSEFHEIAHSRAVDKYGAEGEVLAESVAYAVCNHFGFDTGARSFPYVALWARDIKVLKTNLDRIRTLTKELIDEILNLAELRDAALEDFGGLGTAIVSGLGFGIGVKTLNYLTREIEGKEAQLGDWHAEGLYCQVCGEAVPPGRWPEGWAGYHYKYAKDRSHREVLKWLAENRYPWVSGLEVKGPDYPQRLQALKKLEPYRIVEVHDDGDLTVTVGGKLWVVTTEGKSFVNHQLADLGAPLKLLTKEIRDRLPPIYSQEKVEDPIVQVKFFTPWTSWTWYAIEFDGEDLFFGLVDGLEQELGYFSLRELESVTGPGGLKIERDKYFDPTPLSEVRAKLMEGNMGDDKSVPIIEGLDDLIDEDSGQLGARTPGGYSKAQYIESIIRDELLFREATLVKYDKILERARQLSKLTSQQLSDAYRDFAVKKLDLFNMLEKAAKEALGQHIPSWLEDSGLLEARETPKEIEIYLNVIVKHYRAKEKFHPRSFRVMKPNDHTLVYLGCLKSDSWTSKSMGKDTERMVCGGNMRLHKTIVNKTAAALKEVRALEAKGVKIKMVNRQGIEPRSYESGKVQDSHMAEIEEAIKNAEPIS